MPARIRLQRKGKKGRPFYHVVIADGRAPRDGKYIEKIGTYNPLTKPADIDLDFDRALYWLQNGAQPTDTVRALLSLKGVLMKNHLLTGVKKGAFDLEQAEIKFAAWLKDKEAKIEGSIREVENEARDEQKKRLEGERKVNEARAKELSDRRAAELRKIEAERAAAAPPAQEETPSVETHAPAVTGEDIKTEEVAAPEVKEETEMATANTAEQPTEEVAAPAEEAKEMDETASEKEQTEDKKEETGA
ncbi:MAG: 30S ribosomal protein S16 [Bacteroidales bacterium]|nr:30S ribosomal protein S16 [Bacteroidales bacterium]